MSKQSAQEALFAAIAKCTKDCEAAYADYPANLTGPLKDLALAFRLVAGGIQPGSAVIEKR